MSHLCLGARSEDRPFPAVPFVLTMLIAASLFPSDEVLLVLPTTVSLEFEPTALKMTCYRRRLSHTDRKDLRRGSNSWS